MKFKKLEMSGFKSFFDKTNFFIEDGLTGIVGPNGCGKSNIVEALRWCMGETSAKSMRGSGMEDVIFSGTSNRPPKNISEVCLTIDNSEKEGQGQYVQLEEIVVKRKIERDKGSILIKFFSFNKFKISTLENHLKFSSKSIFLETYVIIFEFFLS